MKMTFLSLVALAALVTLALPVSAADLPDGQKLLAQVDDIRFPPSFFMRVTLTTVSTGEADKVMTLDNTHKKGFGSFLEIQAPARSKGTKMLTQEGTLWMFNPKSGSTKPLRLAPRDSFQGSSFSNSDVSKTSFTEDYAGTTEGEETIETAEFGTVKAWRLRADATNPEASYGHIVMWVRQGDLLPLKFDYYAKSGLLFRQMQLSAYKTLAGRLRATNMAMTSLDKKGTSTVLHIDQMEIRDTIPDSLYNLTNLTK
ncbi:MAG TPA: outer membrane lipoprotein-sorting protein [Spirochaetia bacterium]|jgi:outer membrane lipoprotein-sorting protein|nr:outer membrane lipoprotein-sorting protein [Spirochaetia bacterium]